MRIAAIYDIHGNLPALDAVLQEIREAGVDQIVVGGDVVLGPMTRDCLTRLLSLDAPVQFIQGNCETGMLAEIAGTKAWPEHYREAMRWVARELPPEYLQVIAGWPQTIRVEVQSLGEVLFCHATPRDNNEVFTRQTAEERLLPIFENLNVSVVVCGHTHMQFDRMVGKTRVVNAGSVGSPFGDTGAYWLLLGPDVELRHTAYDLTAAAERIRSTKYPLAEEFAARNVRQPSAEAEILELYSRMELK